MTIKRPNFELKASDPYYNLQKLQNIKQKLFNTINVRKKSRSIEGEYRSKANKIYKDKLKKVFHPLQMQQRDDILNFQNYFDQYVQQSNDLKKIKQNNDPYMNQTIDKMTKSDIFQVVLTLNTDSQSQIQALKPPKSQKLETINKIQQKLEVIRRLPRIMEKNSSQYQRYSQSPIIINSFGDRQIGQTSPYSHLKQSKLSSENKSIRNSKQSLKYIQSKTYPQQYFSPSKIISRLNQINSSKYTIKDFRMNLQVFKEFFIKNNGNEIFSTYFQLSQILTATKLSQIFNCINTATPKQKLMIAFLTLDFNKDGFICQRDLFQISKNIDFNSIVNQDITKIMQFCKNKNYQPSCISNLPKEFYQNPKRKIYSMLFEKESLFRSKQQKFPFLIDRVKYFTINASQSQRDKFTYITERSDKFNSIKINFKVFEGIFESEKCNIITNLKKFFIKQQNQSQQSYFKLGRKFTVKSEDLCSQSLQLNSSNRSIEKIKSAKKKYVNKLNGSLIKMKNNRSNTQNFELRNILCKDQKQICLQNKIKFKNDLFRQSNINDMKKDIDKECQICHKQIDQSRLQYGINIDRDIQKAIIQKLDLFKTDRSNLDIAHGVIKDQQSLYQ